MNEQDIQFVRKAIENRWLVLLYFWRIPKYLKLMADEIEQARDMETQLILERDEAIKANTHLIKWVRTTHPVSTSSNAMRVLLTAGKRLKVILFLAFAVNAFAAAPPPLLRQYFTTNAHVLSNGAGALTNNGSGTLGWMNLSSLNQVWTNDGTYIYPNNKTNNVSVPGSFYAATNNNLTYLLIGEVEAGIAEMGLPYDGFKFGIFETPRPTVADIDIIWRVFSPGNNATHEFYAIARTNDNSTYTFHEVSARRNNVSSVMTMRAQATTNNNNARATISANTTDATLTQRSSFDLKTFGSSGAIGNGGGEAMFTLKTTLPNITNALFADFKTNDISVFSVDDDGNIYNKRLTPSTVLWANSLTNIASIANGTGALTNDGAGALGWFDISSLGGGFIATNAGTGWFTTLYNSTNQPLTSTATANKIQAAASQTGDLQQWLTSAGRTNALMGSNGHFWLFNTNQVDVFKIDWNSTANTVMLHTEPNGGTARNIVIGPGQVSGGNASVSINDIGNGAVFLGNSIVAINGGNGDVNGLNIIAPGHIIPGPNNTVDLGTNNLVFRDTWTSRLRVGIANQAVVTNILSGSATLNFASQSLGGSEDLPITVTGAADGDAVSLGYESTVATGIIGSYSAWASNGVVFVRFIATAATQNPNSGVFKVVVTKVQ